MRGKNRFSTFQEFWPYYVHEHQDARTRVLHFIGTLLILPLGLTAMVMNLYVLVLIPVVAYSFAWLGHLVFEKNRPATFQYPVYSLMGDFKVFGLMLVGKMGREIEKVQREVG